MNDKNEPQSLLDQHLRYLKLSFMQDHHQDLAAQAAEKHWSHLDYLERLELGGNSISNLPSYVINLKSLKRIVVEGNPLNSHSNGIASSLKKKGLLDFLDPF